MTSTPERPERPLRFLTLGPEGSCHENAVRAYLRFHRLTESARISLCSDLVAAIDELRADRADYVVQCSAHLNVHLATERAWQEAPVVDTFIYPTKPIALLLRSDVTEHRSLGLVPATAGYVDAGAWETVVEEVSKPVVGRKLLEGHYDAGVTTTEYLELSDGRLRLGAMIGEVTTTWVVYGRTPRFTGEVIGTDCRDYLLAGAAGPTGPAAPTMPTPATPTA
ncbi:hypothetical protein [Streptomyces gobiensis]|uniref:hypothetical protein n=1 Tax=Streptomyces gobiensis TaxID=2875706 RepID=UPI001E65432D|nr:hypothetical protein [Streptomyces gobiensis]UGY93856.1 hypothetical protein test1122_20485 [Streptomyces gobiensis]